MLDEALKSARKIVFSTIIVFLVWIPVWPKAIEKLELQTPARHLYTWLLLDEYLNYNDTLKWYIFEELRTPETIWSFEYAEEARGGAQVSPDELKVHGKWQGKSFNSKLILIPNQEPFWRKETTLDKARLFKIQAQGKSPLPFDGYEFILLSSGKTFIFPEKKKGIFRERLLGIDHLENNRIDPSSVIGWEKSGAYLASHGYSGPLNQKIMNHSAFQKLMAFVNLRSEHEPISVFGLKL